MAEKMAPKLSLEKRLESGGRLIEGESLGLFHPNTVEARDSQDLGAHCQKPNYFSIGLQYKLQHILI